MRSVGRLLILATLLTMACGSSRPATQTSAPAPRPSATVPPTATAVPEARMDPRRLTAGNPAVKDKPLEIVGIVTRIERLTGVVHEARVLAQLPDGTGRFEAVIVQVRAATPEILPQDCYLFSGTATGAPSTVMYAETVTHIGPRC